MKFIKLFFISAIVLFVVLTCVFLLFPSHIRVSRVININTTQQKVYSIASDFASWEQWNDFTNGGYLTNKHLSSPSSGKDAFLRSDQASVTILNSSMDSVITKWQQGKSGVFNGLFQLINSNGITTVEWDFDFQIKWYPWQRMGSMFYDKQMGPVMETSLLKLKQMAEKNQ